MEKGKRVSGYAEPPQIHRGVTDKKPKDWPLVYGVRGSEYFAPKHAARIWRLNPNIKQKYVAIFVFF